MDFDSDMAGLPDGTASYRMIRECGFGQYRTRAWKVDFAVDREHSALVIEQTKSTTWNDEVRCAGSDASCLWACRNTFGHKRACDASEFSPKANWDPCNA